MRIDRAGSGVWARQSEAEVTSEEVAQTKLGEWGKY